MTTLLERRRVEIEAAKNGGSARWNSVLTGRLWRLQEEVDDLLDYQQHLRERAPIEGDPEKYPPSFWVAPTIKRLVGDECSILTEKNNYWHIATTFTEFQARSLGEEALAEFCRRAVGASVRDWFHGRKI